MTLITDTAAARSWGPDAPGDEDFGDRTCWPDPASMTRQLRALGVEPLMSAYFNYVRPGPTNMSGHIVPPSVNWLPGLRADAFVSNSSAGVAHRSP